MGDMNDLGDLQGHMALHLLDSLREKASITPEMHAQAKAMFENLHSTIVRSFENQKKLPQKLKKLQGDLKNKKEILDQELRHQEQVEGKLKAVGMELKKTESESEMISKVNDSMQNEYEKNQSSLFEKEMMLQDEEKAIRQKIQAEEEGLKQAIDRLKDDVVKRANNIEYETKFMAEQKVRIESLKADNGLLLVEVSDKQNGILMIKDEPTRFSKKADMLESACTLMKKDLEEIFEEITKSNKTISEQQERIGVLQERFNETVQRNQADSQAITEDKKAIKALMDEIKESRLRLEERLQERYKVSLDIKASKKECANRNDFVDTMRNQIDLTKRQYKKLENTRQKVKDSNLELEMSIDNSKKKASFITSDIKAEEVTNADLLDQAKLTEFKARMIVNKTYDKVSQKNAIEKQIVEMESQLGQQHQFELAASKKIKTLTNMRESMARKASQAMSEVRETREELKIKELTILDLMKRHQETEFKLNSVKALYEEAKSARNKYVNMIQNSSQDLAELKEQIKISQNELEILKNEAAEKTVSLAQYTHTLQLQLNVRDRENTHLNKIEYQKNLKKKVVDQNVNEIEKLNMTVQVLEKDMMQVRKKYEIMQESRNYTGVQLIDRNDELCIFYEKSNIHEKILRQGEFEVKELQDEERMINLEIAEKKRQIQNALSQLSLVPQLAQSVVSMKEELKSEKATYYTLSDKLEDPSNPVRWRELGGEDPDREQLDARTEVLEERLNAKKEELLEKQLILDEINHLSEKLRSEALDNRQATLEVTEKLNEFQFRLKQITRKMMATIAELSMYQAMAIKLQKERDELEEQVGISKSRVADDKPPTLESELDYQKALRDKLNYQEQRRNRLEREHQERTVAPFATRTTAEHRVNAYIPDEIGIPKPYGQNAPFKPSVLNGQIRHYRNPEIKEVEV